MSRSVNFTRQAGAVLVLIGLACGRAVAQDAVTTIQVSAHAVVNVGELARQQADHPPAAVQPKEIPHPSPPGDLPVPPEAGGKSKTAPPTAQLLVQEPTAEIASPSPVTDFEALGDNNSAIPPDTMGAVGPNHLMVALRTEVRIQSRDGTPLSTVSLASFWAATGATNIFGPRLAYDPFNNRWLFAASSDASSAAASILMGVSENNDPTGTWYLYRVDADAGDLKWADLPALGFNKNWVAVSVNMYANADDSFQGYKIFLFTKFSGTIGGTPFDGLYSGQPSPRTQLIPNPGADGGAAPTPAVTYDNSLESLYLARNWNGNVPAIPPDPPGGYLRISRIYDLFGSIGAETYNYAGPFVLIPNTTWAYAPSGFNNFAPQQGTSAKIQNGDATLTNVVYRNGSLWTAQNAFVPASGPTRTAAQWWQFLPDGTLQQFGRVQDTSNTVFYAYPSIAVNSQNDVMLGFTRFSGSSYPSAAYAARNALDAPGTMRDPVVLKAGETSYYKVFGGTRNRWGDYSATVVDPVNDVDFWTIQEYADSPQFSPPDYGRWGTWWGLVNPPVRKRRGQIVSD